MAIKTQPNPEENPEEARTTWLSDLARISLLAEFIEDAYRTNCDCRVCQKLRQRGEAFRELTKRLPKM